MFPGIACRCRCVAPRHSSPLLARSRNADSKTPAKGDLSLIDRARSVGSPRTISLPTGVSGARDQLASVSIQATPLDHAVIGFGDAEVDVGEVDADAAPAVTPVSGSGDPTDGGEQVVAEPANRDVDSGERQSFRRLRYLL